MGQPSIRDRELSTEKNFTAKHLWLYGLQCFSEESSVSQEMWVPQEYEVLSQSIYSLINRGQYCPSGQSWFYISDFFREK